MWLLLPLLAVAPSVARADTEAWANVEMRAPLVQGNPWLPNQLRVWSDFRFGYRYPGLGLTALRVGPMWDLHPNLLLALHATSLSLQTQPGVFVTETRLEVEPTLRLQVGPVLLLDRNRFEWRARPGIARPFWRYRNLLRAQWQPEGSDWMFFVSDEYLTHFATGFDQNRASVGVGHVFAPGTRVELSYMLRTRATPGGLENDHVGVVLLFFAPPHPAPAK